MILNEVRNTFSMKDDDKLIKQEATNLLQKYADKMLDDGEKSLKHETEARIKNEFLNSGAAFNGKS